MQTKTALLVTGIILVVVAATMARVETVYAVTAIEYAPGQIAKDTDGRITAQSQAPGQQAAQTDLPASQFAPGIANQATVAPPPPPPPCLGC